MTKRYRSVASPSVAVEKTGAKPVGDVDYIDSSGLGSPVSVFTSVRKQGAELKLLNLTNKVHDVMQITKLYTIVDILNDETDAVKFVGQSLAATL
jgi:anti-anti-sigma factor